MHEQIMRVFGRLLPGTMICGSCTLKSVAKRGLHMSPSLYQFGLLNDSRFALNTEWDKRHQILNDELSISGISNIILKYISAVFYLR
jgi:hypothetical protein